MIQLSLNRTQLQLGEAVQGNASWTPESGENPRNFYVKLQWRTEGRGTVNSAIVWEQKVPAMGMPLQIPINASLPVDGPVTYNGNLIRIIWEVIAGLDVAMRQDPVEVQMLTVMPRQLVQGSFGETPVGETPVPERPPW